MDDNHFNSLFLILFITLWLCISCSVSAINNCSFTEREALIAFKQSLKDPSYRLSSWGVGLNCCHWHGITCDFVSGRVTKIDLRNSLGFYRFYNSYRFNPLFSSSEDYKIGLEDYKNSCLGGEISPSLLQLKYLNYLDLSLNYFEGAPIPYFFGMLKNLRYLNLSDANFGGEIPHHLGNLSRLNYLDLSLTHLYSLNYLLRAESLNWLSGLSSLQYLDLGFANLSSVKADWMHTINMLSSLTELHFQQCSISNFDASIPLANLTSLQVLDLSFNWINSSLPLWLSNLTTLIELDLSYNNFRGIIPHNFAQLKNLQYFYLSENKLGDKGHIPSFLRHLCKLRNLNLGVNRFGKLDEFFGTSSNCSNNQLESLDLSLNELVGVIPNSLATFYNLRYLSLSGNKFMGPLPNSIGNLSLLQSLNIANNLLNGTIPPSFGQLSELIYFHAWGNSLEGVITESHFVNLIKLEDLHIQTNKNQSLVFNMSYDWIPPFRLKTLYLENCHIGPHFPVWLRVQTQLTHVHVVYAGITGTLPEDWISNISSSITVLNLSNNYLNGTLPWLLASHEVDSNDPNHNPLEDSLLLRYNNLTYLNLENNLLSGPVPSNIGDLMPRLEILHLSNNFLNGTIPSSIEEMSYLKEFSLSYNQLSGELLGYWGESKSLCVIDLANNNLSGKIPSSMGLLTSLTFLRLNNNHLYGEIPKSLQNCPIKGIDLSENRLYGNLPWFVSNISLLNLRSNFFSGTIPRQWCDLTLLRILDLSNNNLSGVIPSCLYNWTAFIDDRLGRGLNYYPYRGTSYRSYAERTTLIMKGKRFEYGTTLQYVMTINLARNRLSGEIPNEITSLVNMVALNLSHNDLVGSIPKNIGDMQRLETLDLSSNHFSGQIPNSLASLTFLTHLNLSFNNLIGRVPTSTQLEKMEDPSIYEGNPSLCGFAIQIKCPGDENANNNTFPIREREGQAKENSSLMFGFYMSMAIGFPVGLNILFFTILIKKSWRASYFGFIDRVNYNILDIFVLIEICIRRRIRRWTRN